MKINKMMVKDSFVRCNERFKTLKDIELITLLSADKYSFEFSVRVNDSEKVVKIFVDDTAQHTSVLKASNSLLMINDLPFVQCARVLSSELSLLTTDMRLGCEVDVFIIDELASTLSSYMSLLDEGAQDVVGLLALTLSDMLNHNRMFDRLSLNDFLFSEQGKVILSVSSNFIYGADVTRASVSQRAYCNFLTAVLLRYMLEAKQLDRGEGDVLYIKDNAKFDLRSVEYFTSSNYLTYMYSMIKALEDEFGVDCADIIDSLTLNSPKEVAHKLISFVGVAPRELAFQGVAPERYELIGEHSENRIAVRDNETGLRGFVDFSHKVKVACLYAEVTDFAEGVSVCVQGEHYGAIDYFGKTILPFDYEFVEWCSDTARFLITDKGENLIINR